MLPTFLRKSYALEKQYLKLPRLCLMIIGFYPETSKSQLIKIWAFVNFFILAFCSLTSFYYALSKFATSIPEALEAICPETSGVMSLIKIVFIWYYRDEFKMLIKRIRKLHELQNSPEKLKIKRLYFTIATRLSFVLVSGGFTTATCYILNSDVKSVVRYFRGDPVMYQTPFHTEFPAFLMRMPWFPIALAFSHWYGYVTVCCFVAGDGIFCSFCFYITSLLKLLAVDLKDAFEDLSHTRFQKFNDEEIYYKLTRIIERYNEISNITKKMSDIMAWLTLAHFFTSSMVIGISAINLFLFPGYGVILYGFYTSTVVFETFLYCIGGSAVMESSEDLATVAYSTPWYNKSVKIQKAILTLMTCTQRSLAIKVPFFVPSLPVLSSILRTAGSLIALANSLI